MFKTLTVLTSLTCGQVLGPPQPVGSPAPWTAPGAGFSTAVAPEPERYPVSGASPYRLQTVQRVAWQAQEKKEEVKPETPPVEAPQPEPSQPKEETPAAPTAAVPDRWFTMKALQGTSLGTWMIDERIQVWGWTTS